MYSGRTNVNKFIIEQARVNPELAGDFAALISDVVRACKAIAHAVARGELGRVTEAGADADPRQRLARFANDAFLRHCEWGGHLAGMSSKQMDAPYAIPQEYPRGRHLLVFDPIDGYLNTDVNISVGSIFSVLRCAPECATPTHSDFLQPGTRQIAAGYALYGPATLLVLTVGSGVFGFTLDPELGEFILTHPNLQIPADTLDVAVNIANERFWDKPVKRYVRECMAGQAGPRGADFNMRWIASLVADLHRIFLRGGVFLYPRDSKDASKGGRLRLMFEANPIALLVEQAGGAASTGRSRILDVEPAQLHERGPVIFGSRNEVRRLERYHAEADSGADEPYTSPLFGTRSLFIAS